MYENDYDEYMRTVLGYGYMPDYRNYHTYPYPEDEVLDEYVQEDEIEECYPEIYKIVYPMVQKACMKNARPISKNLIDEMVEEIYSNIEPNDTININVNLSNTVKANNLSDDKCEQTKPKPEVKSKYAREKRVDMNPKETRQKNFLLSDLIRILLVRELFGRPERPVNRPPQRPPMRPPYPGERPSIRPRGDFDYGYGIYEY